METSSARAIHDPAADFYIDALRKLQDSGIPFLVGGAFAFSHYAHVRRDTKDIDVFVRPEDLARVLLTFDQLGYETEVPFPHWLGKIHRGSHFMDIIFSSGNGVARVDDLWFEHSIKELLVFPGNSTQRRFRDFHLLHIGEGVSAVGGLCSKGRGCHDQRRRGHENVGLVHGVGAGRFQFAPAASVSFFRLTTG